MKAIVVSLVALLALAAVTGRADAYPQFQLSRDQTCTSCHVSPAGGGLLNENGEGVAESLSQFGSNGAFLNGAVTTPSWLSLGGDVRAMGGYMVTPQRYLTAFPMQGDIYARAVFATSLSLNVTGGFRKHQEGNEATTSVGSREHYLMWQSNPGGTDGLYLRAGHLMPVFGLRLAEHPTYTRRYGGTPLWGETYGLSASYVSSKFEGHVTGFIKDPLVDPVVPASGAAAYAEYRLLEHTQVGAGFMVTANDWEYRLRGTFTAKQYLCPNILLQGELQVVNPHVGDYGYTQIIGHVMTSYAPTDSILIDLGLGHYDENVRITTLDRDAVDLNVHYFITSHLEAMLVTRLEAVGWGSGGPGSGWAFGQIHYRL